MMLIVPTFRRAAFLLALTLVILSEPAAAKAQAAKPYIAWPAQDGLLARVGPSKDQPIAAGDPLKFLEPCWVYGTGPDKQAVPGWSYVVRRSAPDVAVGWIASGDLLAAPASSADAASHAPRLVVVSNTVLSLQVPGAERLVEVPLLRAPRPDAARAGAAQVMDLYFQYRAANGYLLIGREPRAEADAAGTADGAISGWIAEDLVVPYDGRLAVRWDRDSTLPSAAPRRPATGQVFRARRDAYDASTRPGPALFEEQADEDGTGLELPLSAARMPLRSLPVDDEFPEFDHRTNNQLLRVAGLGALLAPNEKPPTRAESGRISEELKSIQAQLTTAKQVLFVIDDTNSMKPQFPRVAKAVQTLIDDATRNPGRPVEVAVTYYNDDGEHRGRDPGYQSMRLVDARSPAGRALLDEVATHADRTVDGSDYLEMVATGLEHALDDSGFETSPGASRLVVLIGDHGNRGTPDYDRLVGKVLGLSPDRVEFVVIQVVDPDRASDDDSTEAGKARREAARMFRDQMTTLVERLNRKAIGPRKRGTFVPMPDEGAGLTALLDRTYEAMKVRERELDQALARLSARSYATRVGLEMTSLLSARGVSVEQVQALVGVRVSHDGYVWRWSRPPVGDTPGVSLVRVEALLSRAEARTLADRAAAVLEAAQPLAAMRKAVGGDGTQSFRQVVLDPLGLPSSSLLFLQPAKSLTSELVGVELPGARQRLGNLLTLADPSRPSPRWFHLREGSVEWCWIDVEAELP
jgi:hypothetical protein